MTNKNNCYICESKKIEPYKEVDSFLVYRCRDCKFLWVKDIDRQKIVSFYNQSYFYNDSKIGYKNYLADEKNHRKNARGIINTVSRIKDLTGSRILDLGCAYGFLLDEAKKIKKCEAYGIEINNDAYEYAKNNLLLKVTNCELDSCNFEPDFFDAVFLIGTLEHLVFPKETLAIIHDILKPDGLLVITTIDTRGLFPLYSIKPPEHLYYFNHNNLLTLLDNLGYKGLLNKTYFVSYQAHDLCHRIGEFLSLPVFRFIPDKFKNLLNFPVKIPTNEIIVIATKKGL